MKAQPKNISKGEELPLRFATVLKAENGKVLREIEIFWGGSFYFYYEIHEGNNFHTEKNYFIALAKFHNKPNTHFLINFINA